MSELAILIRDRKTGGILRVRARREPAKLRLCRACRRPHVAVCRRTRRA